MDEVRSIDGNAIHDKLIKWSEYCMNDLKDVNTGRTFLDAAFMVNDAPTIGTQTKGFWIQDVSGFFIECSNCHIQFSVRLKKENGMIRGKEMFNYCCRCGAKMDDEWVRRIT